MTPRIPGADYSAASKAPEPSTLHSQPESAEPEMGLTQTSDKDGGSGLNLHAFTHCPDCKGIIHRESGCPYCLTGKYQRGAK